MEKLEPVLKQKFWILLGVAVLMTFIGWWMATSEMSAAIVKRKGEIEASFGAVPQGSIPNESWAKQMTVVNAAQDRSIKSTHVELWKRQLARMTWPQGVEPVNGYWGKFSNDKRDLYRESYPDQVIQVWKTLNPMDEEAGTGIVKYPLKEMFNVIGKGPWPVTPPDYETMWEIQEDLWLLESLFQTISTFNGGYEAGRAEAILHEITKLQLRGGGEKAKLGDAAAAGGDMAAMAAAMGGGGFGSMGSMPTGLGGSGATAGGGGALGGLTAVSAEFDPTEEFGDDGSSTSVAPMGGSSSISSMMATAMSGGGSDTATPGAPKQINRYVTPKDPSKPRETGPFRTRGFYLSVKMDHTKIPLFIEELSSNEKSVWPIEILRVQMSRLNEDSESNFSSPVSGGSSRFSGGNMSSIQSAMAASIAASSSGAGAGGFNPLGGASGGGEDRLAAFGIRTPSTDVGTSQQAQNAKSSFENALKDPVMAQVTICGVFTLYNKVEEPETVSAPPAATGTEETSPVEANGDEKMTSPLENATSPAAATDPVAPSDTPADQTEQTSLKADAITEPKAESKPESKPDGDEK